MFRILFDGRRIRPRARSNLLKSLLIFVEINVSLFIFNLIPVPPLDGTRVLLAFLPPRVAFKYEPLLYQYGAYVLLAIIFIPFLVHINGPIQFVFDHDRYADGQPDHRSVSERRPGGPAWWAAKVRQFRSHVTAAGRGSTSGRPSRPGCRPALLALFDAMPVADRRHGLDVVASLRAADGGDDPELLLAGLLHDCGKSTSDGRGVGLATSGRLVAGRGLRAGQRPRRRPPARATGPRSTSSATTPNVRPRWSWRPEGALGRPSLIRDQDHVPADRAGELLHLADEAN